MLIVVLKRNQIVDFKYFERKGITFYLYIIINKILFKRVEVLNNVQ